MVPVSAAFWDTCLESLLELAVIFLSYVICPELVVIARAWCLVLDGTAHYSTYSETPCTDTATSEELISHLGGLIKSCWAASKWLCPCVRSNLVVDGRRVVPHTCFVRRTTSLDALQSVWSESSPPARLATSSRGPRLLDVALGYWHAMLEGFRAHVMMVSRMAALFKWIMSKSRCLGVYSITIWP